MSAYSERGGSENFEVVDFSDIDPDIHTLVRKEIIRNSKVNEDSLIGGVIKSGEPLLIPKIELDKTEDLTLSALR